MRVFLITLLVLVLIPAAAKADECVCPPVTAESSQKIIDSSYTIFRGRVDGLTDDQFWVTPLNLYKIKGTISFPLVVEIYDKKNINPYARKECADEFPKKDEISDFIVFESDQNSKIFPKRSVLADKCQMLSDSDWRRIKSEPLAAENAKDYIKEECSKSYGHMTSTMGGTRFCNPATNDGGKDCSDSSECEGFCLPKATGTFSNLFGSFRKLGKCTSYVSARGCEGRIDKGKWIPAHCDSE